MEVDLALLLLGEGRVRLAKVFESEIDSTLPSSIANLGARGILRNASVMSSCKSRAWSFDEGSSWTGVVDTEVAPGVRQTGCMVLRRR